MTTTSYSTPATGADLKRLGFVRSYGSYYYTKTGELATAAYSTGKQYMPKDLLPRINAVENTVSSYSSPALANIQDRSDSMLKSLDGTVDYVAKQAGSYYSGASSNVSSVHSDNMQRFHKSRNVYFNKVQEAVEYVKSHGLAGSAQGLANSLLGQIEGARSLTEEKAHFATIKVKEAWANFQSLPLVEKILTDAKASTGFAWSKYISAHDAALSHPVYHKAVQAGSDSVSQFQGTGLYKSAKTKLYPSVAPYADPALDKIQANSYYKAAVDHLKPVHSNGKLT